MGKLNHDPWNVCGCFALNEMHLELSFLIIVSINNNLTNTFTWSKRTALYIVNLIILSTWTGTSINWKLKNKIFNLFEAPNKQNCCANVLWMLIILVQLHYCTSIIITIALLKLLLYNCNYGIILLMLFITSWRKSLKPDPSREICTSWVKAFLRNKHHEKLIWVCYCSTWKYLILAGVSLEHKETVFQSSILLP